MVENTASRRLLQTCGFTEVGASSKGHALVRFSFEIDDAESGERLAEGWMLLFCLGCQKESEAIVSIALHPTNAEILYVATNDAVYKSRDGAISGNGSRVSAQDV
ncbi:MAG: hypothetical protein HC938_15715 [Nitrospira sp.]|nr:hypothetical protein [Nitrospira sp.]